MTNETHNPACECENIAHFTDTSAIPTHPYGEAAGTVRMETMFGEFRVCRHCADTCLRGLAEEVK